MRFVIDAQLPPALARWIERRGHEAEHVVELGLLDAADRLIAARAESTGAVLVSRDEDSKVLRQPDRFAFIWLRMANTSNRALLTRLAPRWPRIEALLDAGERLLEVR